MSAALTITPEDLKAIVATAVAAAVQEARRPLPPTEQELSAQKTANEQREIQAQFIIQKMENERALRKICTHSHPQREGGGTHCAWVREEDPRSPGYIYCQFCQGRIRPGNYDEKGLGFQKDRSAIYDHELFNKLFQDCGPIGLMG